MIRWVGLKGYGAETWGVINKLDNKPGALWICLGVTSMLRIIKRFKKLIVFDCFYIQHDFYVENNSLIQLFLVLFWSEYWGNKNIED